MSVSKISAIQCEVHVLSFAEVEVGGGLLEFEALWFSMERGQLEYGAFTLGMSSWSIAVATTPR